MLHIFLEFSCFCITIWTVDVRLFLVNEYICVLFCLFQVKYNNAFYSQWSLSMDNIELLVKWVGNTHLPVLCSWAAPGGGQGGQLPPCPRPAPQLPPIFG